MLKTVGRSHWSRAEQEFDEMYRLGFVLALVFWSGAVFAQDRTQTLADLRTELLAITNDLEALRGELDTSRFNQTAPVLAGSILDRINDLEGEVRQMTALAEEMTFRLQTGLNDIELQIQDMSFRLAELEGRDPTQSLGPRIGAATPPPPAPA
ncbi:MAG: hypothetical protein AAGF71_14185, partial [Pseudomonadota bacterium]